MKRDEHMYRLMRTQMFSQIKDLVRQYSGSLPPSELLSITRGAIEGMTDGANDCAGLLDELEKEIN